VRSSTIAPGTFSCLAAASTTAGNAWGSMIFNPDSFDAGLVAVVVAEVDSAVAGSVVDEQLASNIVRHAATPAMRVLVRHCARETMIVATTASAMGRAYLC